MKKLAKAMMTFALAPTMACHGNHSSEAVVRSDRTDAASPVTVVQNATVDAAVDSGPPIDAAPPEEPSVESVRLFILALDHVQQAKDVEGLARLIRFPIRMSKLEQHGEDIEIASKTLDSAPLALKEDGPWRPPAAFIKVARKRVPRLGLACETDADGNTIPTDYTKGKPAIQIRGTTAFVRAAAAWCGAGMFTAVWKIEHAGNGWVLVEHSLESY